MINEKQMSIDDWSGYIRTCVEGGYQSIIHDKLASIRRRRELNLPLSTSEQNFCTAWLPAMDTPLNCHVSLEDFDFALNFYEHPGRRQCLLWAQSDRTGRSYFFLLSGGDNLSWELKDIAQMLRKLEGNPQE